MWATSHTHYTSKNIMKFHIFGENCPSKIVMTTQLLLKVLIAVYYVLPLIRPCNTSYASDDNGMPLYRSSDFVDNEGGRLAPHVQNWATLIQNYILQVSRDLLGKCKIIIWLLVPKTLRKVNGMMVCLEPKRTCCTIAWRHHFPSECIYWN